MVEHCGLGIVDWQAGAVDTLAGPGLGVGPMVVDLPLSKIMTNFVG